MFIKNIRVHSATKFLKQCVNISSSYHLQLRRLLKREFFLIITMIQQTATTFKKIAVSFQKFNSFHFFVHVYDLSFHQCISCVMVKGMRHAEEAQQAKPVPLHTSPADKPRFSLQPGISRQFFFDCFQQTRPYFTRICMMTSGEVWATRVISPFLMIYRPWKIF